MENERKIEWLEPFNFRELAGKSTDEINTLYHNQSRIGNENKGVLVGHIARLAQHLILSYREMATGKPENLVPLLTIDESLVSYEKELVALFAQYGIIIKFHHAPPGQHYTTIGGTLTSTWKATAELANI